MNRRSLLIFSLSLLAFALPAAEDDKPIVRASTPSDNGYALYSWQEKGKEEWHFALLPAPSVEKLKTAAEIATAENTISGIDALKKKLAALALNEKIGWYNMYDKRNAPEDLIFDFPNKEIVKDIELHSTALKIRLNIYRRK